MLEIDESERDKLQRVKRTRIFPRPTYIASSARAEMQWCGELIRVRARSQAIAVVEIFVRTMSKNKL